MTFVNNKDNNPAFIFGASDNIGKVIILLVLADIDVVVLPYESATQSGVAQVAYGFDKPVITTDVGGLKECVFNNKTGFLVKPKDINTLSQAIIKFYSEKKEKEFIQNIKKEKNRFSWDKYVNLIESF